MTKRDKVKHKGLDPSVNLRSRHEHLADLESYRDGVRDVHGNLLIRALTEEEIAWQDKYASEVIGASFTPTQEIKYSIRASNEAKEELIRDETIYVLEDEIALLEAQLESLRVYMKKVLKENRKAYVEELRAVEDYFLKELREEALLYSDPDDHRVIYNENNSRNADIYTRGKARGTLLHLDPDEYDKFYSDSTDHLDSELALINEIEPDKEIK